MREGRKKNVMVYLDPKIVEEARELGLNISKVCENALKEAIRRLKGEYSQNNLNPQLSNSYKSVEQKGVDPAGFEPAILGSEGPCPDPG